MGSKCDKDGVSFVLVLADTYLYMLTCSESKVGDPFVYTSYPLFILRIYLCFLSSFTLSKVMQWDVMLL